jgi:uncharacterized UPF0160 family protein
MGDQILLDHIRLYIILFNFRDGIVFLLGKGHYDRMVTPRSCAVHDGLFHADEVTACALLLLFNQIDRPLIVRTRDEAKLAQCEFVCDVGSIYDPSIRRFDHHQASYTGELSSAGMVLLDLRDRGVIQPQDHDFLRNALITGVDREDNGHLTVPPGVCTFSQVVANFTPIESGSSDTELEQAFSQALDFVLGHLQRLWQRYQYVLSCREQVRQAMAPMNRYLAFDRAIPWLENFFALGGATHPAQFVLMPAGGHWKVRGIPPSLEERMAVRQPLPQEWAGLGGDQLRRVTGIPGAIFCHKGLFISVWETRADAEQALQKVLMT